MRCAGDFDFVLMLEAGADPDLSGFVPNCLTLVSRTDFAALFRVRATGAMLPARPPCIADHARHGLRLLL